MSADEDRSREADDGPGPAGRQRAHGPIVALLVAAVYIVALLIAAVYIYLIG